MYINKSNYILPGISSLKAIGHLQVGIWRVFHGILCGCVGRLLHCHSRAKLNYCTSSDCGVLGSLLLAVRRAGERDVEEHIPVHAKDVENWLHHFCHGLLGPLWISSKHPRHLAIHICLSGKIRET